MCATGYVDDYATVGGKWQRSNPTHGRVGSIFSDAGTTISDATEEGVVVEEYPSQWDSQSFGDATYPEGYAEELEFGELEEMQDADGAYLAPEYEGELQLGEAW